LIGKLPPEQRETLAGLVNQFMPTLNPLFDERLAIPGVGELIKPTNVLRTTLAALTTI